MDGDVPPPPPTQSGGKSQVKYGSIFLFKYDIEAENPFSVFPLSFFSGTDFPWSSIEGVMSSESRVENRTFSNLKGTYRIFAKIEKGWFIRTP